MKRILRKVAQSNRDSLTADSHADFGLWIERVGWTPDPKAELETYFRKVEKGCQATLITAYAPQARAVLALCRAARHDCLGGYVGPVRAALMAATLAQAYEELLTNVLLERPPGLGDEVIADQGAVTSTIRRKRQEHDAERLFYCQRFEHYAARLPDLSMRSLRRLAGIDAKDAGWPQRKDSTYAAWTLRIRPDRRIPTPTLVDGTAQSMS
ncbi:MAG: hypothetical protein NDI84_04080 [Steroidobacteraceae bacterium]|nr:hypothetical protein [Steroidobacteraceae bacterium]